MTTPRTPGRSDEPNFPAKPRPLAKYCFIALCLGVLAGLIPMWMVAHGREIERDQALRQLRGGQLRLGLAEAALDARRGEYEMAREEASTFFGSLQKEMDRSNDNLFGQDLSSVKPMESQRDEIITLLARSDPASADRLANLDLQLRKRMTGK